MQTYHIIRLSGGALVRLLGLEHPLGEDHEQVDAAHDKHAAPESHHADNDGLKQHNEIMIMISNDNDGLK